MKMCNRCMIAKSTDEFGKDIRNQGGLKNVCKECLTSMRKNNQSYGPQTRKVCLQCGHILFIASFTSDPSSLFGVRSECNRCRKYSRGGNLHWSDDPEILIQEITRGRQETNKILVELAELQKRLLALLDASAGGGSVP